MDLTTLANVKSWLGLLSASKPITAITRANPGVITCAGHGFQPNAVILLSGINGMTQLNGKLVTVTPVDANSFSIGLDTTQYSAYTNGGLLGLDDALLQRVITGLSTSIESILSRRFGVASYSEIRNGTGKTELMVQSDPIIDVDDVFVDGVRIPLSSRTGQPGYSFDADTIYLTGYVFARGRQNVELSYLGGFNTIPADIDQAMCEAVGFLYRERDRIGLSSKVLAGETTAFLRDLPPHLMRRFNEYNRPFLAPS